MATLVPDVSGATAGVDMPDQEGSALLIDLDQVHVQAHPVILVDPTHKLDEGLIVGVEHGIFPSAVIGIDSLGEKEGDDNASFMGTAFELNGICRTAGGDDSFAFS